MTRPAITCTVCGHTHRPRRCPYVCKCRNKIGCAGELVQKTAALNITGAPGPVLTDHEARELFGEHDPSLWGNRAKALFESIGIPPCGGCNRRREWINKAHAWLRGLPKPPAER